MPFALNARACELSQVPPSEMSAERLLARASEAMSQSRECDAAIALTQAYDQYPYAFVKANGLFTLIKLEMDLGKYDDALKAYKRWPWEIESAARYNPWNYVSAEQEPGARVVVWTLFARFIPARADVCLDNPLTHRCDVADGMFDYDRDFAERFPDSPYLGEMREITAKYYRYKFSHEKIILGEYIADFRNAGGAPDARSASERSVRMQAEMMLRLARPEDQAYVRAVLENFEKAGGP